MLMIWKTYWLTLQFSEMHFGNIAANLRTQPLFIFGKYFMKILSETYFKTLAGII